MIHNSQCFSTDACQYSDFLPKENEIHYFQCVNYSKVRGQSIKKQNFFFKFVALLTT